MMDQSDQAVLYHQIHIGAFPDLLREISLGLDDQLVATELTISAQASFEEGSKPETDGNGGLGDRFTWSISRKYLLWSSQRLRGFDPGTLRSPPSIFWAAPCARRGLAAAKVVNRRTRSIVDFIFLMEPLVFLGNYSLTPECFAC